MQRTVAARVEGGAAPARRQASSIRLGMSPGGRNTASSGSMTGPPAGSAAASDSSRPSSSGWPARSHVRSVSWSSHRPMTLRR